MRHLIGITLLLSIIALGSRFITSVPGHEGEKLLCLAGWYLSLFIIPPLFSSFTIRGLPWWAPILTEVLVLTAATVGWFLVPVGG